MQIINVITGVNMYEIVICNAVVCPNIALDTFLQVGNIKIV